MLLRYKMRWTSVALACITVIIGGCAHDASAPVGPTATRALESTRGEAPAGRVVLYSKRDGNAEINVMRADGTGQRRLTNDLAEDVWPDVSPNGRYVAFASLRTGNREIFVMNLDDSSLVNISQSPADDNWPRWSPDGRHIAFHSNRDGNYELYVANADGSGVPRRVTNNTLLDQWPDWSPDGRQLAFRRGTDVFAIDVKGEEQNPRQLTNTGGTLNQMPVWSPDGRQIAFMSLREGYCAVFLMAADGETSAHPAVNLTPKAPADANTAWCSRAPAWSTDGKQIYFMSSRPSTAGDNEIFVMNADGTGQTRLTFVPGEDGGPRMARRDQRDGRRHESDDSQGEGGDRGMRDR